MDDYGYDSDLFPNLQGEMFNCIICSNVVKKPKECSGCGDLFCGKCIDDWIRKTKYHLPHLVHAPKDATAPSNPCPVQHSSESTNLSTSNAPPAKNCWCWENTKTIDWTAVDQNVSITMSALVSKIPISINVVLLDVNFYKNYCICYSMQKHQRKHQWDV